MIASFLFLDSDIWYLWT